MMMGRGAICSKTSQMNVAINLNLKYHGRSCFVLVNIKPQNFSYRLDRLKNWYAAEQEKRTIEYVKLFNERPKNWKEKIFKSHRQIATIDNIPRIIFDMQGITGFREYHYQVSGLGLGNDFLPDLERVEKLCTDNAIETITADADFMEKFKRLERFMKRELGPLNAVNLQSM